ncbi:peroxidase 5-like [Vicia villosa]|uniref:peroxidase 5-like n=1 Tax=Vicia villosa TaxID=3911 RepID=UPI00273BDA27|nr:peroxidase 5-like [Vicia villosa]
MVTLSGAHTIRRAHCSAFSNRLYNFSSTSSQDPSLHPSYAALLKRQCPQGNTNQNLVIPMDPSSLGTADVGYYIDILAHRGLFTSDQALLTTTGTARQVNQNARNPLYFSCRCLDVRKTLYQSDHIQGWNNKRVISSDKSGRIILVLDTTPSSHRNKCLVIAKLQKSREKGRRIDDLDNAEVISAWRYSPGA